MSQGFLERVVRMQESLPAQHPSKVWDGWPAGPDVRLSEPQLKQQLKRGKFSYLAVEEQLRFLEGSAQRNSAALETSVSSQDMMAARNQARERNRAVKRDLKEQANEQDKLYAEIASLYTNTEKLHVQCERDMQEVIQLMEAISPMDTDEGIEGVTGWENALQEAQEEAFRDTHRLAELVVPTQEEASKKKKLEYEQRCLEQELLKYESEVDELARIAKREQEKIASLENLNDLVEQMGFPRIEFKDEHGKVILGKPGQCTENLDDPALRSIDVQHDKNGRLTRAEPHPSLGLWNEATTALDTNDFARITTLVWDRLCDHCESARNAGA